MSATNRGAERHAQDFYETPDYTTCALFNWFKENPAVIDRRSTLDRLVCWEPEVMTGSLWDPCAGNGAIINAACYGGFTRLAQWTGTEISVDRKGHPQVLRNVDFKAIQPNAIDVNWGAIVTNPPYSDAFAIIEHARKFGCWAWFVLRLNFLGSLERQPYWSENMPSHILVLSERPKMALNKKGKLGSDATEYAWFGWYGNEKRTAVSIEVLPPWRSK